MLVALKMVTTNLTKRCQWPAYCVSISVAVPTVTTHTHPHTHSHTHTQQVEDKNQNKALCVDHPYLL